MNGRNRNLANTVKFGFCATILMFLCAYGANAQSNEQADKAVVKMAITGIPGDNPDGSMEAFAIDQRQTGYYQLADGNYSKPAFSMMVTKGIDSASPRLSLSMVMGERLGRVVIVWSRIDPVTKVEQSSYSIILWDVVITSIRQRPVNATDPASKDSAEYEDITLATVSRLQDGKTAVVAGIKQESNGDLRSSIPVFGMLPFLGRFFTAPKQTNDLRDIVITVTPHIIRSAALKKEDHLARQGGAQQSGLTRSIEEVTLRAQLEDERDHRLSASAQPATLDKPLGASIQIVNSRQRR